MAEHSDDRTRKRVIYTGHVQGVAFRATTRELAQRREVVGFVRNRPDGTVELEAEGPAGDVGAFLRDLEEHFSGYIRDSQRQELRTQGDEGDFRIAY